MLRIIATLLLVTIYQDAVVGHSRQNTTILKHPYQVTVFFATLPECRSSGAILNKYWILTTGGIDSSYSPNKFKVRVGSNRPDMGGKVYNISKMVTHPDYDPLDEIYDFTLIKLSKPHKFSRKVKSIKLATETLQAGQKAVSSGWENISDGLQEIKLTGVEYQTCVDQYRNDTGFQIVDSMVCASGDGVVEYLHWYGGPLVSNNKLYGLYIIPIYDVKLPRVFSNVNAVLSWIDETMRG